MAGQPAAGINKFGEKGGGGRLVRVADPPTAEIPCGGLARFPADVV